MKSQIQGYEIFPGEHCGSVAMRGLLNHYCDLQLPEPAVFGLGSGIECLYINKGPTDPAIMVVGRTMGLEVDLASALGIDYREQREDDDAKAWELVRDEVTAGRPTMLSGDIFYLDYREYKVHFPGHRFVLLGFDDEVEKAYIADRIRDVPEACSYPALAASRNPPVGMSLGNLWGRFHDTGVKRDLVEATRLAIERASLRMLGESADGHDAPAGESKTASRAINGVAAIRQLAEELPGWAERDDARSVARFNASCIEKFGNGGGNFRRLYAGFLTWAHELDETLVPEDAAALSVSAANGWTAISSHLAAAAEEGADPRHWTQAADLARHIAITEESLFAGLAERVAPG